MADSLFLRLFDNSMDVGLQESPTDPRSTFRDQSVCDSPSTEYLKSRPPPHLRNKQRLCRLKGRGLNQFEGEGDLSSSGFQMRITAELFPKRGLVSRDINTQCAPSPIITSLRTVQRGQPCTSTPIKQAESKSRLKDPATFSENDDQPRDNREQSFKIIGPICSLLNKLHMEEGSPAPVCSTPDLKRSRHLNLSKLSDHCHSPSPLCGSINSSLRRENIKTTVERAENNPDLIGDGTSSFCLPTVPGKHQDLKSITPETLAKVIQREYDHIIEKFVIVDCRYPYEYQGGHIQGAKNVYTRECLMANFMNNSSLSKKARMRTVLIFHCEFSSERAPKLLRYLRTRDRQTNKDRYPALHYPEVYLLHAGYSHFFKTQKELCTPKSYRPMHHECYKDELRKCRMETKTPSGKKRSRALLRTRLGIQSVPSCC